MSKNNNVRGRKLTQPGTTSKNQNLINKSDRSSEPFEISIRHSLDSKFSFRRLDRTGLQEFHKFIEKTVGKNLTWGEVDKTLLRTSHGSPWRDELVDGKERRVAHYETSNKGRIFGYKEGNDFIIWKIDPKHNVDS